MIYTLSVIGALYIVSVHTVKFYMEYLLKDARVVLWNTFIKIFLVEKDMYQVYYIIFYIFFCYIK